MYSLLAQYNTGTVLVDESRVNVAVSCADSISECGGGDHVKMYTNCTACNFSVGLELYLASKVYRIAEFQLTPGYLFNDNTVNTVIE